mgnify:CR=1 FL=1
MFVVLKVDGLSVDVCSRRAYLLVNVGVSQSDRVQQKSERRILRLFEIKCVCFTKTLLV